MFLSGQSVEDSPGRMIEPPAPNASGHYHRFKFSPGERCGCCYENSPSIRPIPERRLSLLLIDRIPPGATKRGTCVVRRGPPAKQPCCACRQKLGHEVGPIEKTKLRRFECCGMRHGRQVGLEFTKVDRK